MEALLAGKLAGDVLCKEGKQDEAVAQYNQTLECAAAFVALLGDDEAAWEEAQSLKKALLNNLSMAHLQRQDWAACAAVCTDGLLLDTANLKAYYRRAQAYCAMGRSDDKHFAMALRDVDAILQIEKLNPQAKALRIDVIKAQQELETERKYAYIKKDLARNSRAAKVARGSDEEGAAPDREDGGSDDEGGDTQACSTGAPANEGADTGAQSSYVFMNPNWQPAAAGEAGGAAAAGGGTLAVPSSAFGFVAQAPQASMKDLVKEARRAAAPSSSSSSSKLQESPGQVAAAISELALLEAEAAQKVADRVLWKAAQADKHKTGKYKSAIRPPEERSASALSAWEQLQLDEAEAEKKFKLLVGRSKV